MAQNNTYASLDYDDIVSSLKLFLQSQDQFKDFDFDGAAITELLRLLAYNAQNQAFQNNFQTNEVRLGTATLRPNVANEASSVLGYVPASKRAARIAVSITVIPSDPSTASSTLILGRDVRFYAAMDSNALNFVPDQEYSASLVNGQYVFHNVTLLQGVWNINAQTVQTNYAVEPYAIPDANIDTNTLEVYVRDSITSATQNQYVQFKSGYDLGPTSQIFFLKENRDGLFEINFGDGKFANKLSYGNVITFRYLVTDGIDGNNISGVTPASSVGGYFNVVLNQLDAKSYGGDDNESIDSIKINAPLSFATAGSAVTDGDYVGLTKRLFSEADQVIAWGGEKNNPPKPGYIIIAVKPKNSDVLDATQKASLVSLLNQYNVGSVSPIVVDPNYTYLNLVANVKYSPKLLTITDQAFVVKIQNFLQIYSQNKLEVFDGQLDISRLLQFINTIDPSITGNNTAVTYEKRLIPELNISGSYHIDFGHQIKPSSVSITGFYVTDIDSGATYYIQDDGNGTLVLMKTLNGQTTTYKSDIGNVDYITGAIDISGFNPSSLIGSYVTITCSSGSDDASLNGLVDTILKINNIQVNLEIDNG